MSANVKTGLDGLLADPERFLKGKRFGLVANQTSIASDLRLSSLHLAQLKGCELVALFAPEHGFYGVAQDMEHVATTKDPATGLPVHSLYGENVDTLIPDPALFQNLDALVFDIQDIGSRYYTFIYTLANCMQSAGEAGIPLIVLDRPNPINGVTLEGNLIEDKYLSFVGQYSLLTRHAMTVGELAGLFRDEFGIACDLTVVPMQGWDRSMWFDQTGLPWVSPSPNMPTLDTATVYPGMCLIEGTLLSEGRGTTKPFEQIGAPGIDPLTLTNKLALLKLPGIHFQPQYFKPKFQKCADQLCGGVFLNVTDREQFKPWLTGLILIETIARLFPDSFQWRTEPYEYVSDRLAIDLLYGNTRFREWIDAGQPETMDNRDDWASDLKHFTEIRQAQLLY